MAMNEQKNNITAEEIMSQKIEEAIEPVINSELTNKQKVEQVGQVIGRFIAVKQETFSGPMPPPSLLMDYKTLIPDAPERILKMAEREQEHRIKVDDEVLKQSGVSILEMSKANRNSQIFAFILTLLLIISGVFLTIKGFPWVGGTIFGTTIMGVVAVFITGKTIKQDKSEEHSN